MFTLFEAISIFICSLLTVSFSIIPILIISIYFNNYNYKLKLDNPKNK